MSKKLLLTSAAASAVAAPGAFGELLTSDVFQELFPMNNVYIDLDTNTFSGSNSTESMDFSIEGRDGGGMGFHGKALLQVTAYSGVEFFVDGGTVTRFAFGEALSGSSNNSLTLTEDQYGAGNWAGFTGIAYAGFVRDGNLGWVELDYNPGTGGAGNIELLSFGFANAGESITAGQTVIPEPATTAGVMALLAGSAVLYARRRKSA